MGDLELQKICREIYNKHQKALDLINEYKQDIYLEISDFINEYFNNYPNIILDKSTKSLIRFTTTTLDNLIERQGSGWTSTKRILLYEIQNKDSKLVIKLIIGPGESTIREKLLKMAEKNKPLFNGVKGRLKPQYTQIFTKELLSKDFFENHGKEREWEKIENKLTKFINNDIKKIDNYIEQNWC